jgi:predicted transcriptional regulator
MAQLTLYLDDDTEARLKEAARAEGVSLSRWVADLIRQKTATEWPASVIELAGAWADFPTAEELREDVPADVPRESI